jgi:hypothetical protein
MIFWSKYSHFQLILCLLLFNSLWECRPDGDTDEINTSFEGQIKYLFDEEIHCEVKDVNDKWVKATAIVAPFAPLPTCLKVSLL